MVTNEKILLRDSVISYDLKHRTTLHHNISKYDESVARGKDRYARYDEAREYASGIKQSAQAQLADNLELFEKNTTAMGTQVLWAGDAADAMWFIKKIPGENDVDLIVKNKSIKRLTHAELTGFARKRLRTQFTAAGVGVTGATFLVADIGGYTYSSTCAGSIGSVLAPFYSGFKELGHLSSASAICGHCTDVCPVKIPLHELLLLNRRRKVEEAGESRGWNLGMKAYGYVFSSRNRLDLFNGRIKRRLINLVGKSTGKTEVDASFCPSFIQ